MADVRVRRLAATVAIASIFALAVSACFEPEFTTPEVDDAWSEGPLLPIPVTGAAAASFRGSIYVAGGFSGDEGSAKVFRLTPPASTWEPLPNLPYGRNVGQLVAVGDTLYMVGGFDAGSGVYRHSTNVWAMDPDSHVWERRPDFPDERQGWAVSAADRIVVIGGSAGALNHGGNFPDDPTAILAPGDTAWAYRSAIAHKRVGPRAAALGDRVYVFGGLDPQGPGAHNDYEVYDARDDRLEGGGLFHSAPANAINVSVAVLDGRIHFLGGRGRRDHTIFDPANDTWTSGPPLPYTVGNAAAVAHGGAIWLIGGSQTAGVGPGQLPAVSVYRPR